LLQAALLRALERRSELGPNMNWVGWLRVVMRRMAIDHGRRHRRWRLAEDCNIDEIPLVDEEPEPLWIGIHPERLVAALADCKTPFREVCELYHLHGWSYNAIAQHLGIPVATVSTRLHRARVQLKAHLSADTAESPTGSTNTDCR
jgi:RNA polymerase sigma-70 factor, ECF subfamily